MDRSSVPSEDTCTVVHGARHVHSMSRKALDSTQWFFPCQQAPGFHIIVMHNDKLSHNGVSSFCNISLYPLVVGHELRPYNMRVFVVALSPFLFQVAPRV